MSDDKSGQREVLVRTKGASASRAKRTTVELEESEMVELDEDCGASVPPPVPWLEAPEAVASPQPANRPADREAAPADGVAEQLERPVESTTDDRPEYGLTDAPIAWHKLDYREAMLLIQIERCGDRQAAIAQGGLDEQTGAELFDALVERGLIVRVGDGG